MSKEEIINYVMNSPENTNPSVLRSLLDREGSGQGVDSMVVHIDRTVIEGGEYYTDTLDKTWQEIHDAIDAGTVVFTSLHFEHDDEETYNIDRLDCAVEYNNKDGNHVYSVGNYYYASSPDGYPSVTYLD